MRNILTGAAAVVVFAGMAAGATDRDLVAINNLQGVTNNDNGLISFNPMTLPSWNTVGLTGLAGVGAMDYTGANPQTGAPYTLYAVDTFGGTGGLYSIDDSTGAVTLIGAAGALVDDFAYNPVDGHMYGIQSDNLYQFDLNTGAVVLTGTYNIGGLETGLGFASDGTALIHDLINDAIYTAPPGSFVATILYSLPFDTNYSQGLFVDWSQGDRGYLGAFNATSWDGELWEFDILGGSLNFVSNFGPLDPNDGLPPVEAGDLTAHPGRIATCQWYCGAGTNMNTYTVSSPYQIGGIFQGTVGIPAPNVGAVISGFVGQLTFSIWGQQGLVNVGTAEVMGFPSGVGVSPVVITWAVPNVPGYAGFTIYTQAAGFGGGVINLTCAHECMVGY
jgi:hypothetical protein